MKSVCAIIANRMNRTNIEAVDDTAGTADIRLTSLPVIEIALEHTIARSA